jgi:CHAD domain-containing protein
MAKARPVPVDPDEPFGEAARRILPVRARELVEHVPGVRHGEAEAPLHDLRVAARRLRAALEVFAGAFPKKRHARVLDAVKRHTERMGEARDLDVQIAFLHGFLEQAGPSDRPGVEWLVATLQAERATAYGRIGPDLDDLERPELLQAVDDLAAS